MKPEKIKIPLTEAEITAHRLSIIVGCILPLPLITQIFNASNLYMKYSPLLGHEKLLGSYFVGIGLEISVFACILAGSRAAGGWFAIISFFVGILFHDSWDSFLVDTPNLHDLVHITYHKEFYATTLLQLANSILTWFLSSLFIELRERIKKQKTLKELEQKSAEIRTQIAKEMQEFAELQQKNAQEKQSLAATELLFTERKQFFAVWEQNLEKIKDEVAGIQKQKGAHSKHLAELEKSIAEKTNLLNQ